jgi:hypothetical protein
VPLLYYSIATTYVDVGGSLFGFGIVNVDTLFSFLAYFPKKESEAYEITSLSVRLSVSSPITFEPIGRFL